MLSNTAKLYFPKLVYTKTVTINDKPLSLYRLDWARKELKCAKGFSELSGAEETLAHSSFAIPDSYIKEIRRLSWASVAEWNEIRLLPDTMRGIYLRPAVEMVHTAFFLLADCKFDEETNFYDRSQPRGYVLLILLRKFWINQVKKELADEFTKV
jgi:hypothetical protein